MTSLDIGIRTIRGAVERLVEAWRWYDSIPAIRRIHAVLGRIPDGWRRISRWLNSVMPKGLYARALLIIILPMVILQSVIAFVFMERHWNVVTAAAVGRRGAGHRRADRRLPRLSAGRRRGADPPHRAGAARPGGRFPAA